MVNYKSEITRLIVKKGPTTELANPPGTLVMPFEELVHLARQGTLCKSMLHFREVQLKVREFETVTSPFLTVSLLKMLSRGNTTIEDDRGNRKVITWPFVVKVLLDYGREWFENRTFQASTARQVDRCVKEATHNSTRKWNPDGQPVYLRTDFTNGIQAGGSVGHIAGVLNNLENFSNPPIFITSDHIPSVDTTIETHIIEPDNRFLSFPESRYLNYSGTYTARAKKILQSRRVSFVYQRYSLNNYAGYNLSRYYNVPFVLEYNGSEIWVGKNWGRRIKNEKLSNAIEELNLRAADLIVVVSESSKDEIEKRGVEHDKILVNPNGVDSEKYSPDVDGSWVRDNLDLNGKTIVGFIGTFGRWHGVEVLVEAFGALLQKRPEYRGEVMLLLIGDGLTMPIVKEQTRKKNIIDNVIFAGVVPQDLGPAYLAACDILVSPHVPNPDGTPFFGSPTKIFEYMAMGKGIVASNIGQIGEVLEHMETAIMVEPGNALELMDGLSTIIENPDLGNQLGKKARTKVTHSHTWKLHTEKIIDAIARLDERH